VRRYPLRALCSVLAVAATAVGGAAVAAPHARTVARAASPATGIGHVFVVVIENEGFDKTFAHNPNP